jgi:hypothetical protein
MTASGAELEEAELESEFGSELEEYEPWREGRT